MANIQHHIIRRQFIDVEMYGTESDGQGLQRTLPDFCQNRLIPACEKALNRFVLTDSYLTIEQLVIDAGTVQLERLEHDLPDMVARALVQYLQDLPQTDELSNTLGSGNIQRKTKRQVINEAFLFFLKNGTLPWSFYLPPSSGFKELIQGSLKEPEGRERTLELFKNEVIETLSSATARKRLIRQFTPAFLESLIELISTEGKKVLGGILPLLRSSDTSLVDPKRLEQEVWECAFACIASGSLLTEACIRRETTAFLTAQGIPDGVCETLLYPCRSDLLSVSDSSSATDDADKEQTNVYQEKTADASVTSKGEEQSHPESDNTEPAKRQRESSSQLQQSKGVDEAQKGAHGESTMFGSVLPEREEQSQPESGHTEPAKCQSKSSSQSQQSEGVYEVQKGVHGESTTSGLTPLEREEQSHPATDNNQAQHLSEPASAAKRSEGSDEGEKGGHHQSANAKKFVSQSVIKHPDAKAGLYTALAGLVILHPFLTQLFRALGIADDDKLLQPDRAIYLLYFLATGRIDAKEYELVIPKMLCHFPLQRALESNIIIATAEQEECSALLAAVIRHWEVLKNTGVEGLQETFLKRFGKLSLLNNGEWLLQVESNACDILLEQLPWGISMIKLPWMPEMLRVEWV